MQAKEHHPNHEAQGRQHHVVGVLCCRRDWCTSKNRWLTRKENYVDVLKQHLKTSIRMLKLGRKCVFKWTISPNILPKLWQNSLRTTQSPDLNPIENVWAELKKRVQARRPTNLTPVHQLCQEEWAKIHPTYCGKLVDGYTKRLTKV